MQYPPNRKQEAEGYIGCLLSEDSDAYKTYVQLLGKMNQVKGALDYSWSYDASTMTEYEQMSLLHVYCMKYMPGIEQYSD